MKTLEPGPTTRAFRPHQLRPAHNVPCCEMADAGAKNGRSQLERNHVSILDARTSGAMRVALEDALKNVASRFNLDAAVVKVVALGFAANFQVVLEVRGRSKS